MPGAAKHDRMARRSTRVTPATSYDRRVTIVVASRDRREHLLETVPRHVALPERPRVLVVDNASRDGTESALCRAHPGVGVLRLERNAGGAARNHGARAATTPYVAFTDERQ